MRKTIVIAVREYQAAVKTKAFIISIVLMPILMGGSIAAQLLLRNKVDIEDKKIAILDYSGQVYPAIVDAAEKRNSKDIYEGEARKQVRPRYVIEQAVVGPGDPEKAALELSDRVRKNDPQDIMAFVVVGPDVVKPGDEPNRAVAAYHSNRPTYDDIQRWLYRPINDRVQELRFAESGLDAAVVQEATQRVDVANLGLVSRDEAGNVKKAEKTNEIANILLPMGMMMLMFMVIMVGASPLIQSVLEEKTLRIAEVLLGSVRPFQLMMGKLLGMVGVSLTMATVYLVGAFYALQRAGPEYGITFPAHVVWWFVAFLALAVLLYGSLFIAIGAAVSDMKEAQSLMTPVMLIVMMPPLCVWINVVKEPLSTFSTVFSLIPPATPMLMVLRQTVPPGVPIWQPILGVGLVLLTTILCVFAAGRVFRVGILMQGKGANLREMTRWVLRG